MNRFWRWVKLFIVVIFVGMSLQYAAAQEPQNSVNEKDWNEWGIKVSQFVVEKSKGILDKKAAELIIGTFSAVGKEESILKPILVNTDPSAFGNALWDALKQPVKGVDIAGIGAGILVGVVTEVMVDSTRKNWGATGLGEEVKKELTVFGLRQAGVLYATTLGLVKKGPGSALVGASAAEAMVVVKTLKESIAVGKEIIQTNEQTKITEAQVAVGDIYLKLKADLKAATTNDEKKKLLVQIDQLLQGDGSFLFASSNDPIQARKNHIENLAKNAGLSIGTPQQVEPKAVLANTSLLQNQLTAITQGGSSHIGSAALFTGHHTSTPPVINPIFTASLKNQTAAEQGIFANSQAYDSAAWVMVSGDAAVHKMVGNSFGPVTASNGGEITSLNNANVALTHMTKEFTLPPGVKTVTLTLNGNFVTNEYPVFVGSQYNDYGVIKVISPSGTATQVTAFKEVLNSSNFQNVSGLPTPMYATGGQTGFKASTVTIPVANGGKVIVDVQVHNVGDTLYPSAVLMNNIQLK